jgi:predicted dithiol-disulfide oxidoreductase (DUF899 family)
LDEVTKRHSKSREISFDSIAKSPNEEVIQMFDKILFNLNTLSQNNAFFREYYQSFSETNNIKEYVQFKNDIEQNRNYLPLNQLSPRKKGINLNKDDILDSKAGTIAEQAKEETINKDEDFDYE